MKDDNYRLIGIYLTIVLVLIGWLLTSVCRSCGGTTRQRDTTIVESKDTIYITMRDTLPAMKGETIVRYIKVQVPAEDTAQKDSIPVVQRIFTDDSIYTAYISGIRYDSLPKLDSIIVRQRTITNTIREIITEKEKVRSRWNIGIQGGYGIGLQTGKPEPFIGIGISYSVF